MGSSVWNLGAWSWRAVSEGWGEQGDAGNWERPNKWESWGWQGTRLFNPHWLFFCKLKCHFWETEAHKPWDWAIEEQGMWIAELSMPRLEAVQIQSADPGQMFLHEIMTYTFILICKSRVSVCDPGWTWTLDTPAFKTPECWNYKLMALIPEQLSFT
jgi:hypothetical protein